MANDVMVEFGAKIDALVSAVDQVKAKIGEVGESTSAISEGFSHIKEIIVGAFAVESIIEFIHSMGALGLQTERLMAMLGTTAQQTLELGGMAALTGTSIDGLALSVERMTLNIQRSQTDAFTPAALGLQALGLRAKDLIGLPAAEYFDKLHEAVSNFGAGLTTTNAVMAVGGRGVAQMMPLLLLSAEEWEEYKTAVVNAREGLAEAIPGMAQTHQSLTLLDLAVQSFGARVFSVFQPALQTAIKAVTEFIEGLDTSTISTAVQNIVTVMSEAVKAIGEFFILAYAQVADSVGKIIAVMGPLLTALNYFVVGVKGLADLITTGAIQWDNYASNMAKVNTTMAAWRTTIDTATVSLKQMLGATEHEAAGLPELGEAMKKAAPAMAEGAKQANEALMKLYDNTVKGAQDSFNQQKAILAQNVALFAMSQRQMDQELIADAGQRTATQVAAWQAELSAATLNASQRQEIENKITEAVRQGVTERINLQTKYATDTMKVFDDLGTSILSSWNMNLKGLLTGTTTWATAMKNTWVDLTVKIIEQIEMLLVKLAALAAAEMLTGITPGGGSVFSGQGFMAAARSILHLQEGTPYVPKTQLAVVHEGEMVIPPNFAQAIRSGEGGLGGGGAKTLAISINAIDAQSVQTWLRTSGAAQIARFFNQNPAARPSY